MIKDFDPGNINTVLFDFGDTLVDDISFSWANGLEGIARLLNITSGKDLFFTISNELGNLFDERDRSVFELDIRKYFKLNLNLMNIYPSVSYEEIELVFWENACHRQAFDNLVDFLNLLKERKINLGVISNCSFSGKIIEHELKKQNIAHFFDLVISSSDYQIKKPSKYIYEIALKYFGIQPEQALFIGDKIETDMIGAKNAGIKGLLFDPKNKHGNSGYDTFQKYDEMIKFFNLKKDRINQSTAENS